MQKQMREQLKADFKQALTEFVGTFRDHISTPDDQWTIKGFIDVFRNIYTISADTKIVSKILEIHLFPKLLEFANRSNFRIVLAEQQNYYPDLSFVYADDENIKFAVDLKPHIACLIIPNFVMASRLALMDNISLIAKVIRTFNFHIVNIWGISVLV